MRRPTTLALILTSPLVFSVRADAQGRRARKGLPAGEYYALALPLLEPGQETDPAHLALWRARATRVTLADQEAKPLVLRLTN